MNELDAWFMVIVEEEQEGGRRESEIPGVGIPTHSCTVRYGLFAGNSSEHDEQAAPVLQDCYCVPYMN